MAAVHDEQNKITIHDVLEARKRIENLLPKTPLWRSQYIDDVTGRQVFLKCENLQETGSFKIRGMMNTALMSRDVTGLAGWTTGGFGIAVAWAAKHIGVPCAIVMDPSAYPLKGRLAEELGADVIKADVTCLQQKLHETIKARCYKHVDSTHREVIAGQGTVGLEILEQESELDAILVQVGSGSLAAGIATVVKATKPDIKVYCVEPMGKNLAPSLAAQRPLWEEGHSLIDTIATGLASLPVTGLPMTTISRLVESEVLTVSDADITHAMETVYTKLRLVVEPSACAGLAAILGGQLDRVDPGKKLRRVAVILTGGNVDFSQLPWLKAG